MQIKEYVFYSIIHSFKQINKITIQTYHLQMDNCTLNCIQIMGQLDYEKMCSFTQEQCMQTTVQFVQSYYCYFKESSMILIFIGIPLVVLLFKTLNFAASNYMSPCVEEFIQEFKISPTLAGVTFLAFANGAPDVLTAIIAGSSNSAATALIPFGSIFGACLFAIALIFSAVILTLPNQTLTINLVDLMLPIGVYITGIVFIICVTIFYGKMNIYIASVLLLLYIIYIVIVVRIDKKNKKKKFFIQSQDKLEQNLYKKQSSITSSAFTSQVQDIGGKESPSQLKRKNDTIYIINNSVDNLITKILSKIIPPFKLQNWKPLNSVISLIVSPFVLASTQKMPDIFVSFVGPIPVMGLISIPSALLLLYSLYCIIKRQTPYYMKPFTIYSFIISIAVLAVICSILINFVELIQILTGINSVFLGLTIFAGANSIPDYLSIMHFAEGGNSATAVNGIFSGQLFNFLIGFGVPLLTNSISGQYEYKLFNFNSQTYKMLSDSIIMCVILSTLIYMVIIFVGVKIKHGVFMKRQAKMARYYYYLFILIASGLSASTDFFTSITCNML